MSGDLNAMVKELWLTKEIQWDLALYGIFLINLVLLAMQPEGSALATFLGIATLVSAAIDKVHGFGYMLDPSPYTPTRFHEEIFLGTYLIRVIMFAAPLSIAGMTRNRDARGVAVVAGIGGGAYLFIRWYVEQRDVKTKDIGIGYLFSGMALNYLGAALIVARLALRERLRLGSVNRDIPVTVAGDIAAHNIEI